MAAKRKKNTPPKLSAERVRAAALRLIEAEGLEEFSTRKLGRALGVEAMAIYWYYPSKEALLDAVVDLLVSKLSRLPEDAPGGPPTVGTQPEGDWLEALRQLARAYRALAHEYPNAFPLLATRRFATEGTYAFLDRHFEQARRQGLDDRTTARWFRLVSSYCSGVALDEIAGHREALRSGDELDALRARFPRLVAVSGWLAPTHFDEVFEHGLEVLLGALSREAKRPATATQARKRRR